MSIDAIAAQRNPPAGNATAQERQDIFEFTIMHSGNLKKDIFEVIQRLRTLDSVKGVALQPWNPTTTVAKTKKEHLKALNDRLGGFATAKEKVDAYHFVCNMVVAGKTIIPSFDASEVYNSLGDKPPKGVKFIHYQAALEFANQLTDDQITAFFTSLRHVPPDQTLFKM